MSAVLNGGRFRGIRSPAPSPRSARIERTLLAAARQDDRTVFASPERGRRGVEFEAPSGSRSSVTAHAMTRQDRLDLTRIIDRRLAARLRRLADRDARGGLASRVRPGPTRLSTIAAL